MHPDTPIDRGLVMHLDAADVRSYPGSGMMWRDLKGNFDAELPGDASNLRADPHWTGRSFVFRGQNFARILGSQQGFFKTFARSGAAFSIDCCFTTSDRIANPHFLLADGAHGNPMGGSGFTFYFFNFENVNLRISVQNNAQTKLTRAVHATHPAPVECMRTQRAAVACDDAAGRGLLVLDEARHEFDGRYVEPSQQDSPYYVNIGAPGNIEYNAGARIESHVSAMPHTIGDFDERMLIPYGRMRFHPGFELHSMMVYDRGLDALELAHNQRYYEARFFPGGTRSAESAAVAQSRHDSYGNCADVPSRM